MNGLRVEWAVVVFCVWRSADLLTAWRHSPLDRWGWLAFALWLAPLVWTRTGAGRWTALAWIALALALTSALAQLNVLAYAALAVSLAALAPWSWRTLPWLALSVAWMPVLGWACQSLPLNAVAVLRLTLAAASVVAGWRAFRK